MSEPITILLDRIQSLAAQVERQSITIIDLIVSKAAIESNRFASPQGDATHDKMLAALRLVDAFAKEDEASGDDALWSSRFREIFEAVRDAIAKAEGRPP